MRVNVCIWLGGEHQTICEISDVNHGVVEWYSQRISF